MDNNQQQPKKPEFVPFQLRGDTWKDVQPVEQYQGGPAPIAPIKYPPQYVEVMNYFRAIFKKQEISDRALALTQETIMTSPGQYTAWTYRRKLLNELGNDLGYEIAWLNRIGLMMEKNYQFWHHRRCIFEMWARQVYNELKLKEEDEKASKKDKPEDEEEEEDLYEKPMKDYLKEPLESELLFMDQVFDSDAKNYHGWSHKIWLIERFELWTDIQHVSFIEDLLDRDVNNNSVWSFRYFIMERRGLGMFSKATVNMELRYVVERRIPQDWRNEAVWTYLRGYLAATPDEAEKSLQTNAKKVFIGEFEWLFKIFLEWAKIASYASFQDMLQDNPAIEQKLIEETSEGYDALSILQMQYDGLVANRFLFLTLADMYIGQKDLDSAHKLLESLKGFDPMRSKFYQFRQNQLKKLQQTN